jgi:hypothetical protein
VWEYESGKGVWNILGGSLIGSIGPTGATGTNSAATIPLATNSLTGVASFNPLQFTVSATGNVVISAGYARLAGDNQMVGQNTFFAAQGTVFSYGITATTINTQTILPLNMADGLSGYIGLNNGSMQMFSNSVRIGGEGGDPAVFEVINDTTSPSINLVTSSASGEQSVELQRTGLVFGGPAYSSPLMITGGVFRNPSEFAPHFTLAENTNELVINGISGSIQRFTIDPSQRVTVKMGTGWHSLTAATETIAVIVQNISSPSMTGVFDSNILTEGSPSLFGQDTESSTGVPGAISILTLMRVNKGGGSTLNMGFVIATGMTAANFKIN